MAWHTGKPATDDKIKDSLQHIRENFTVLEPLVSYIGDILDSRIVEHNLDVANPPNGYYVRWDNGLQICSVRIDVGGHTGTLTQQGITIYRRVEYWTLPAVFLQAPHVSGACSLGGTRLLETVTLGPTGGTGSSIIIAASQISEFNSGYVDLIAVGRWK